MKIHVFFFAVLFFLPIVKPVSAQSTFVDGNGVWRYSTSNKEIAAFGVNYAPSFAHSFRRMKQLGIDHKECIKKDVYHFARLGLDAYRVHIWDCEITDREGNLLKNEHLDTFDFLIAELKKKNIQILLTPLALMKNGYPDQATNTPGFINQFDKQQCSREREAFMLQANYLKQLMDHVNPYTGLAYKDDPSIIGIELNNEPHHTGTPEQTKEYIETLIKAVRSAGYQNPLFYNMSQNPYLRETYYTTDLDGFSFQWYPTGLPDGDPITVNTQPYVTHMPDYTPHFNFGEEQEFKKRARILYEMGVSNAGTSYTFAAMARALREAGFQFAAYFSYDPIDIAQWNTEYPKHYMNLAYTPRQAIGLMVAAEAFRQLPRGKSYGNYPEHNLFENFRVNHRENLAELADDDKFYYNNTTRTAPPNLKKLKHIAGCGSSPVVKYDGSGAYFLDKISDRAWRLEVMPDTIPVRNPFQYKPDETAVVIQWNKRSMVLKLPELGDSFTVRPINKGNMHSDKASNGQFFVKPGTYVLGNYSPNLASNEFYAPTHNSAKATPYYPDPPATKNMLANGNDYGRLFFSQGSNSKIDVLWEKPFSVNAKADIYGWDPPFVQFGYSLREKPTGKPTKLRVKAKALNDHQSPVQVELGMDDGSIFGAVINLKPKMSKYTIKLSDLKPVPLASYASSPSFLPVLSKIIAPSEKLDVSRLETIRFTIGPSLTEEQKKQRHGIALDSAWLEK